MFLMVSAPRTPALKTKSTIQAIHVFHREQISKLFIYASCWPSLTLLQSERPKLCTILSFLKAIGLNESIWNSGDGGYM